MLPTLTTWRPPTPGVMAEGRVFVLGMSASAAATKAGPECMGGRTLWILLHMWSPPHEADAVPSRHHSADPTARSEDRKSLSESTGARDRAWLGGGHNYLLVNDVDVKIVGPNLSADWCLRMCGDA